MLSRRRPSPVLDDDRVDELPQEAGRAADVADTLALAVAALARARAIRLRRQAEAAEVKESDVVEPADAEEADVATELDEAEVTDSEVAATGVESMTDDTAVVFVAVTSRITNDKGAKQDPRTWRLSVAMARDGDRIKMAKVEFVP